MFRNGQFVGKSNVRLVTSGEKFTAGFGIDSQVQAARELEEKTTQIEGGNSIDTYNYRIAVSNYKDAPVKLRLYDRLPYTETSSIKIEDFKSKFELSPDAEYLRTARKKGILRWDLDLKGRTTEKDATVIKYSFVMKYDRDMQVNPAE